MTATPTERAQPRADIQALRAVAVSLVILFHLSPGRMPGGFLGVDVFFVISGFLITSHLLREQAAAGRIRLAAFWGRRIRRLLPAAMLVLMVTLIGVLLWVPVTLWQRSAVEIGAAAVYVENWVLAASAVDYFAADQSATAVQHYWSLSAEEQFYLVWPLLLVALTLLRKRWAVAVGVGFVLVGSFAYSVVYTAAEPAAAYFSTFTHAWEFAAGAALCFLPALRLRAWLATAISAVGFGVIVAMSFLIDGTTAFPGWIAAIPVAATAAIIAVASQNRVVSWRPIQALGDVSYSAYLWHWPLIVIVPFAIGADRLTAVAGVGILAVTLVLAWLTRRWVEEPLRRGPALAKSRAFAFAAGAAAAVVAVTAVTWTGLETRIDAADKEVAQLVAGLDEAGAACFGAAARLSGQDCPDSFVPRKELYLARTSAESPELPPLRLAPGLSARVAGNPDSDTTIALIGDSHAAHYLPALKVLAAEHDWRILVVRHNSCIPTLPDWVSPVDDDNGESCVEWRTKLKTELPKVEGIDAIVTSSVSGRYDMASDAERAEIAQAYVGMWDTWQDAGMPVVAIVDVPGPGHPGELIDCVMSSSEPVDPCNAPRSQVLAPDPVVEAGTAADVRLIDWTDLYCGERTCHGVIGGLVVYGNGAHLTRLFSQSLAPYLEPAVLDALG